MRQFLYGLILGAAVMYAYEYLDVPGLIDYLNSFTQSAAESTHGYR